MTSFIHKATANIFHSNWKREILKSLHADKRTDMAKLILLLINHGFLLIE